MKKFFCRISKNHTAYVKVGGVDRKVVFDNSIGNTAGFGEFVTDDEAVAQAMLSDSRSGRDWFLSQPPRAKAVELAVPADLEEKVCGTVNEAVDWLVELGRRKSEVNTSVKAVEAAKEMGFDLKFDKGDDR